MLKRSFSTVLTRASLSASIREAEYAVRGAIVLRSLDLAEQLKKDGHALPFDSVVPCNIGNPQEVGQSPISFPRQVIALTLCPALLDDPQIGNIFPEDAIERAREYLKEIPNGTGAYSHSKGVSIVRNEVAKFVEQRDGGHSADPEDIFLTDGASPAVQMALNMVINSANAGVMIPIPQYPLYSAAIKMLGGRQVDYFLDESAAWGTPRSELERSLYSAREQGVDVRALAVINPGNPTGQCLDVPQMEDIVQFCDEEGLVLMADEVYQENIWSAEKKFTSFKKVVRDMASNVELFSFHSVSKGFLGECGRRGGYVELTNIDEGVKEEMYKLASVGLCSNVVGQLMVGLMVNPPKAGDASFAQYASERDGILESLSRRATKIVAALNELKGVTCNLSEGALYAFPQITLPQGAVDEAAQRGCAPDALYCMELLEKTGIVVVPGSGFGQADGTFHFRTTILPQEDAIDEVVARIKKFHEEFMRDYQ
eukprot:g851.t1